jgi:hypothetical protein
MTRGLRLIAPFKPFAPESALHQAYADFDWIAQIQRLLYSGQVACAGADVRVVTDLTTDLPVPLLRYPTAQRRLMLWTLEALLRYVESPDFDRNTVALDCDQLIYRDLAPFFHAGVDLGVLIRPTGKHVEPGGFPLLNGVLFLQWHGRHQLPAFFARALDIAAGMPEDQLRWGADQEAVRLMLEPLELGIVQRSGLTVCMRHVDEVIETISQRHIDGIARGECPWPVRAVLDGRWRRKEFLAPAYEQTIRRRALEVAC